MHVCIMCGGEGTRLRPLTFERPKPCIPIVNRPSIQHLVSHLANLGFLEIVVTIGYKGSAIEDALGDGSLFGAEITYVHEPTKLGTAGSVKNAQQYLDEGDFLVVGGDHVTNLNLVEFFRDHLKGRATTTIGLISIEDPTEYGIAEIDAEFVIKRFKEKPAPGEIFSNLASTGMYVCNPAIFDFIPRATKFDFARDLFPRLMEEGLTLKAWLARGNWTDVGNPAMLRRAEHWKLKELAYANISGDLTMRQAQILGPVTIGESFTVGQRSKVIGPVAIGSATTVGRGVLIGPYTSIGEGCHIMDGAKIFSSSVYDGVIIGEDTTVSGSIIDTRTVIGDRCCVENDTVIGPRVVIGDGVIVHSGTRIWPDLTVPQGTIVREHLVNDQYDTGLGGS
ncbi:MAG: NDP-sugar synthase [Methanomicrobiales archaeon]|nr:NDP-sugar synthase [Methanomicrobiales archaeon]